MWMEGRQEGVAGGCVREVATARTVRCQSYQDAPERLCGTALRLLLRSMLSSSLRVSLQVMT